MVITRGAFSYLLAPGLRKIVFDSYKERPIEGRSLVNFNTSSKAYEEDLQIAGFGALLNKPEGASVRYQDPLQGVLKRYTWSTYALGFRITQEAMEDDLYGVLGKRMSKALGRSARNNLEFIMHSPFNNAFDTAFSGFTSGESLVSTSHSLVRGGTLANRAATDTDFDLIALQAALEHFHALTDESGLPIVYIPKWVVHSIGDHWIVNQVLKSQFLPGSNLNDINQVSREGLQPHLSHFLTDPDAWFVLADNTDINYFERRAGAFSNTDDFNTGDALFKFTRRNGAGFSDWRGVYGSQGV